MFELIIGELPGPVGDANLATQFQCNNLDYDDYIGRIAIGRIRNGRLNENEAYALCREGEEPRPIKVTQLFIWKGLKRVETTSVAAGELVAVAGIEDIRIGDTIADPERPSPLPAIRIDEPTISMVFAANTGPWAGREGDYVTSSKLRERLLQEQRRNVSMRVEDCDSPEALTVTGRGELQLAILIETMRREGYELQVSKPSVVIRDVDGVRNEPMELLVIDVAEDYIGVVSQLLAVRRGKMIKMTHGGSGQVRLEFHVPSRGLIGFRSRFLTETRGTGTVNTLFEGWAPWQGSMYSRTNGSMVADREGTATPYSIFHMQERGTLFVAPGTRVYEGMIVGEYSRTSELNVNITREKKQTNMRASGHDENVIITPHRDMGLEAGLEWIDDDELVEITPKSIRLRKMILSHTQRPKHRRAKGG